MLVLTRKSQEEILIGDSIRISVVRIKGNAVRLGIEAPRDVRVVRGELPPHDRLEFDVELDSVTDGVAGADEEAPNQTDDEPTHAVERRRTPALRNDRVQSVLRAMLASSRPA